MVITAERSPGRLGPERNAAIDNEIIRGIVGSTAHGTAIEGQDDRDEMGVFVEPAVNVCGLTPLDHYVYRDQPEGVRSQPGDLDLTLFSLRKFCRMATQGNPSVLILMWLPDYILLTELGRRLVALRGAFISKNAGERFLGYLVAQRRALTGEKTKTVRRPELVEKYGYDTKFAMHALRLGLQGIEYLTQGRISLPVAEPDLSTLRAVRSGAVAFDEALALIRDVEANLRDVLERAQLKADVAAIDRFLVEAHRTHWAELGA